MYGKNVNLMFKGGATIGFKIMYIKVVELIELDHFPDWNL